LHQVARQAAADAPRSLTPAIRFLIITVAGTWTPSAVVWTDMRLALGQSIP
jgi:hypothetical protein